jgi:hypothetical protein
VVGIGWAIAHGLRAHPAVNRRVVGYAILPNPMVRISFAVDLGDDLDAAVVDHADQLTVQTLQRQLTRYVRATRDGGGPFARPARLMSVLPVPVSRPLLRLWSTLSAGFGVPILGHREAPFGAALISSVASFGLPAVDAPFIPFSRCALVVSVGAEREAPVVVDGQLAVRPVIDLGVTADHRICDGAQFAAFTDHVLSLCGSRLSA